MGGVGGGWVEGRVGRGGDGEGDWVFNNNSCSFLSYFLTFYILS